MTSSNHQSALYWHRIPAWKEVAASTFSDPIWQERNCITSPRDLIERLRLPESSYLSGITNGVARSRMSIRLTPHIISLIDWDNPAEDPIRRQFLPHDDEFTRQHPLLQDDALGERNSEIGPGLVHRYPDRVLFLAVDTCPVYCRFCTRSYSVGGDTEQLAKVHYPPNLSRWSGGLAAIAADTTISDVVLSGGDILRLKPRQLEQLVSSLYAIDHIRHIRLATKGLSVLPMKILLDDEWIKTLTQLARIGREKNVDLAIHTHVNHPNEITYYTEQASMKLFSEGITVRNQSVLLRDVNDTSDTLRKLYKTLGDLHIRGYYTYVCDPVKGIDDMRTSISKSCSLEIDIRGHTSGFNTPIFVVDLPDGGGKRDVHSYEYYNKEIGLSVYKAPSVKADQIFLYPDPLHSLSKQIQNDWFDTKRSAEFVSATLAQFAGKTYRGVKIR